MWSPLLRPSALVRVLLSRGTMTLQCQVRIFMTASLDGFVIKSCLSTPLVGITREYPLRPSSASGGYLHHLCLGLPSPYRPLRKCRASLSATNTVLVVLLSLFPCSFSGRLDILALAASSSCFPLRSGFSGGLV